MDARKIYGPTAGAMLARGETATKILSLVRLHARTLPWWAWLRRRELRALEDEISTMAVAWIAASEAADRHSD